MSNTLNEKFEEFATEQADVLKEYQDPMPTVTATVVPGTGSEPTQVSGDPQQASSGKDEPSGSDPKVPEAVANGQSRNDLGGSQSTPLHAAKGEGEQILVLKHPHLYLRTLVYHPHLVNQVTKQVLIP